MTELKVEPDVLTVVTYSYLTSKELWRGSALLTADPHSLAEEILAPRELADYHTCVSRQYEPETLTMHVLVCATMNELLVHIKDSSTFHDNNHMICRSFHLNNAEWARRERKAFLRLFSVPIPSCSIDHKSKKWSKQRPIAVRFDKLRRYRNRRQFANADVYPLRRRLKDTPSVCVVL